MPFPVPGYLIPYNIFLNLVAVYMLVTDTRLKKTTQQLRSSIGADVNLITANELGVLKPPPPGLRLLVSNSPEIDYPFDTIPPYIIPCGPIVRASPDVAEVDPALASWLARGPTIYINLGTHLAATPKEAADMARAVCHLLDRADEAGYGGGKTQQLQVLWKLKRKVFKDESQDVNDYSGAWQEMRDVIGRLVDADRVRITNWVTAEPKSVLQSHHVVCSVNHGGASSFHEALW